ncbi:hypothetical protein [Niallia circulans]|nr:hypothetical protein [Niallia circulans]
MVFIEGMNAKISARGRTMVFIKGMKTKISEGSKKIGFQTDLP